MDHNIILRMPVDVDGILRTRIILYADVDRRQNDWVRRSLMDSYPGFPIKNLT